MIPICLRLLAKLPLAFKSIATFSPLISTPDFPPPVLPLQVDNLYNSILCPCLRMKVTKYVLDEEQIEQEQVILLNNKLDEEVPKASVIFVPGCNLE